MSSGSHRYTHTSTPIYKQRIDIPIQRFSSDLNAQFNEQHIEHPVHSRETTTQWIHDSITGREKFRIKMNIEGFNQNDVHIRVDGNRLFVYGERIENKSQGISKKIIEKSYELPADVDKTNPHVTFPSPTTMQVDLPLKNSTTRSHQSTGYLSSRKLHDNDTYDRKTIVDSRIHSPDHEIIYKNAVSVLPIQRISINARDPLLAPTHSNHQLYKFHESIDDPIVDKNTSVHKQIVRRIHRRCPSPTVGFQSPHVIDHRRSVSPALSRIVEEDHVTSSSSSNTDSTISNNPISVFPRDFNSDHFYQSVFQPEIFTDDRHQRYIEMRLDVHDYKPHELKVSINDNDLVVQVEHSNFYKHITLPSNTDLTSLAIHHHHDKKLYITVKLLDEYSSFKYI